MAVFVQAALPPVSQTLLLDGAAAGQAVIAVGERGAIARSVDAGRTWEMLPSPTHATLTCVSFADARLGWAAGHDGVILQTSDGGLNWVQQYADASAETTFLDILALDTKHIIAVGAFGVFQTSSDGGRTWQKQKILEEDFHLNRISKATDDRLFIAGEHGSLAQLDSSGGNPQVLTTSYSGSFYGVLPLDGNLLAYGQRSHVFRSTDQGKNWTEISANPAAQLLTAIKLKSGLIVIAGQARMFFVSHDDGLTFTRWENSLTTCVSELLETSDGALIALGEAGATRLNPPTP